jgi:hypothetical protein
MNHEHALKSLLVLVGALFSAMAYPVIMILWLRDQSSYGELMGLGLYVALGGLLLAAVRNPLACRNWIAVVGWSSLAHAVVLVVRAVRSHAEWPSMIVLGLLGAAFLLLLPTKPAAEPRPAADARHGRARIANLGGQS